MQDNRQESMQIADYGETQQRGAFGVLNDLSPEPHYNAGGVPLFAKREELSYAPGFETTAHWHSDIEALHVQRGSLLYRAGKDAIELHAGDCLFLNGGHVHNTIALDASNATFSILLFSPTLLSADAYTRERFIDPVLDPAQFSYCKLEAGSDRTDELAGIIDEICRLTATREDGFQLICVGLLHAIIAIVARKSFPLGKLGGRHTDLDEECLRSMIAFIQEHYDGKITLADIAAAGNVSKSKCSQVFKGILSKTPIEFLNAYRLEVARKLLERGDLNIAQIATACGFSQQSYFSRQFGAAYGCTPREYRAATR